MASQFIKDKTRVLDQEGTLVKNGSLSKTAAWWTQEKWDCDWVRRGFSEEGASLRIELS